MPAEQSSSSNAGPSRTESPEKNQHPAVTSVVRRLLGLPLRESGVLTTAPLAAPPRAHQYGHPPLPESKETDDSFRDMAQDDELIEGAGHADRQNDFPGSLPHEGASISKTTPGTSSDSRSAQSPKSEEDRESASFVIPGISSQRTEFGALSRTSDTPKITRLEESHEPGLDNIAPLHTSVSLPHQRETAMFDSKLLSRLERLVSEGTEPRIDSEIRYRSLRAPSPTLVARRGVPNEEQGDTDLARRLAQLQRMVDELAATVSRNRDENQAQQRELKTPSRQRTVIIERSGGSTTPCAFWERSRLGRFYLRSGR